MEQNHKDKGLREAMKTSASPRLSTNFTFRTMLKVQEAIRLKEQKQEKQMFWIIVVASVFLLTGGGVVIAVFCGDEFSEMFSNVFASFARLDLFAFPYGFFLFAVFILLALDYWMRRAYYKRHGKG